jgi:hypothetical protein
MSVSKHLSCNHLQDCGVETPGCGARSYSLRVLCCVRMTAWRSCMSSFCACNIYQHVRCLMVADFPAWEAFCQCFVERCFSVSLQELRFSHWCYRRFRSMGMSGHVVGQVVSDVAWDAKTFSSTLKTKTLCSFKMPGTTHPRTQCNIPEGCICDPLFGQCSLQTQQTVVGIASPVYTTVAYFVLQYRHQQ